MTNYIHTPIVTHCRPLCCAVLVAGLLLLPQAVSASTVPGSSPADGLIADLAKRAADEVGGRAGRAVRGAVRDRLRGLARNLPSVLQDVGMEAVGAASNSAGRAARSQTGEAVTQVVGQVFRGRAGRTPETVAAQTMQGECRAPAAAGSSGSNVDVDYWVGRVTDSLGDAVKSSAMGAVGGMFGR